MGSFGVSRARLKSAPTLFGVALQLGPSGASLSGRVKSQTSRPPPVGPYDLTSFGFRPSNRARLKSAPGWTRTNDPRLRRPMLYPAELRERGFPHNRGFAELRIVLSDHVGSSPPRDRPTYMEAPVNYSSIGKMLRRARKRLGLSQFDVAEIMQCSRAQVDNIEVARQRAPLYRLEDFAKAVGLRLSVQLVPHSDKLSSIRVGSEVHDLIETMSDLDEDDKALILQLVGLMPELPSGVRGTLRGIVTLWSDRYLADSSPSRHTA